VRKVSIGLGAFAAICALAAPASALAAQTLTIAPTVKGTLGGPGKIGLGFTIASTTGGIPSPLSGPFVESIPPGITYSDTGFPTCSMATIQAATGSTPPTCPAGSLQGAGTATTQAQIGPTMINEPAVVNAYLVSAHPVTLGFWGNGTTPIATTVTWTGTLESAAAPFGSKLNTLTPVIPTVPGGPDASTTEFNITIGTTMKVKKTETVKGKKKTVTTTVGSITLPKKCTGTLKWAATDSYQDGSSNSATATTPCP
jgi:hypothetical protein